MIRAPAELSVEQRTSNESSPGNSLRGNRSRSVVRLRVPQHIAYARIGHEQLGDLTRLALKVAGPDLNASPSAEIDHLREMNAPRAYEFRDSRKIEDHRVRCDRQPTGQLVEKSLEVEIVPVIRRQSNRNVRSQTRDSQDSFTARRR